MKRLSSLLLALLIAGCSLVGEDAPEPKVIGVQPRFGACQMPPREAFKDITAIEETTLHRALDCIQEKIDSAFTQVRGKRAGEIEVSELRTLAREGLLELEIETEDEWRWLGMAISALHPEGRPALSQSVAHQVIATLKGIVPLYTDWMKSPKGRRGEFPADRFSDLFPQLLVRAREVADLFSPEWSLPLGRARELALGFSAILERRFGFMAIDSETVLDRVEALWILKSAALADPLGQGVRSDLRMDSIKALLDLGFQTAELLPSTQRWAVALMGPTKIPSDLVDEWGRAAEVIKRYFLEHSFASIDSDLLAWSLRRLGAEGLLADLAPDLVRLSQRMAGPGAQRGFHPRGFAPLADQLKAVAFNLTQAAPAFAGCGGEGYGCAISLREALKAPSLSRIALKGAPNEWLNEQIGVPLLKPLDALLGWETIAVRFFKLAIVEKIFETFDTEGTGKLPLNAVYQEDLKDTLDLTYTLLRFLSLGSGARTDSGKNEEPIPSVVAVKPSSLYQLMGILGDRWMPDGNKDDALDAQELFSIVQFYEEHESLVSYLHYSSDSVKYLPLEEAKKKDPWFYWNSAALVTERTDFIRSLFPAFLRYGKLARLGFGDADPLKMEGLFHGLVSTSPRRPLKVVDRATLGSPPLKEIVLSNYVNLDETLAPAAILLAVQKLEIACDLDEDQSLNWAELDCAAPLLLDSGLQVITSAMVEIEPGIYDLSRVLLSFLQRPGVPLSLAKLALISGSLERPFKSLLTEAEQWLETRSHLDWLQMGQWLLSAQADAGLESDPGRLAEEAKKVFGVCDTDVQDGEIKGEAESGCATDLALSRIARSADDLFGSDTPRPAIEKFLFLLQTRLMRLGIQIGLQKPAVLRDFLKTLPVTSSKVKILELLEELLRRETPLPSRETGS